MKRNNYLQNNDVKAFIQWFSDIIAGHEKIDFQYDQDKIRHWVLLNDAFQDYKWPTKKVSWKEVGDVNSPSGTQFQLSAGSSFILNESVLANLQKGLREAFYKNEPMQPWLMSIFVWGGVTHGNEKWLIDNQQSLPKIINETYQAILQQDDILSIKDYRFNSGMSKVYSLLCDDFIIYDTRVAAALAWLVTKWSSSKIPPELLYFRCGSARKTSRNKVRNPNKTYFKSLVTGESYALWNMRANWVVAEALKIAKQKCPILLLDTTRKVEAALFMVGNDLQFALV